MTDLLIRNARVVNAGRIVDADVLVHGERIARVAGSIPVPAKARVLEAAGRYLLPGMIDDQVHFREPGLTHKGDMATESAAAVAGGITSFMEMPNVSPQTTTRAALAEKYVRAAGRARANYAFYLGATNHNLEEIRALEVSEACGIKVFMGASTGDMLVDDPQALERLFAAAPLLVVTHCEHSPTIRENEARARARYGEDVPMSEHPHIRSAEACLKSSATAVELARRHDARLHILHLTTAAEMELLSDGPRREKRITGEVCVHHLWFDESRYAELGTRIKCNPAIKTAADRAALLAAVNEGRLDVIATDHAPHTAEEKARPYFQAPAGLPLVQHVLLALFDLWRAGTLALETIVERTSHAVADIYGVVDRGYVREGCYADLVLVDPERPHTVTPDNLLYKCGWSPFEGHTFSATIDTTIVNGRIAWQDGRLTGEIPGQRLALDRGRD
ncbi:MAG TPA: dihydroorotase [Woeseiaceae bacterium]